MPETYSPLAESGSTMFLQATFEKRWQQVAPFVRLHFAGRDETTLNALLADARQYLQKVWSTEAELMQVSSDAEWVELALRGVLRLNETQPFFNQQFEIVEHRLHHWARQQFELEVVDDIVQAAFIKLWDDYQRHQQMWDTESEAFWVSCGKLAMRSAYRELRTQTQHRKGSTRRHEPCEWVTHLINEPAFSAFDAMTDDEASNDVLDMLSQRDDIDIHGRETQQANLRLDLETLLHTVKQHYRPAIFERCLLVLERLAEGYTCAEIRLELGWTSVTYESTMTYIRRMSRFAEGYQRAPSRCTKLSNDELARIRSMHQAGYAQTEIARRIGRDPKTVWRVVQTLHAM